MRKLILLLLAIVLTACAAPPTEVPTQEVIEPTQTPVVIVNTVVVTVIPTDMPTDIPSATPLPPTEVPATPTQPPATQPPATTVETAVPTQVAASAGGLTTLDNALGGGWFTNISLTGNTLALRCPAYQNLTITVTPSDPNIALVDFYYRIEDRGTGAIFDWQGPRRMLGDGKGNFTLTFSGEDVNTNFRKANAWFDFQFIGMNKNGGRIGSSEKIVQQVNYVFDCP